MRETSRIKLLSAIALRQRWRLTAVEEAPVILPELERLISRDARVKDVHGDQFTGRILITLDEPFPPSEMKEWIGECLSKLKSKSEAGQLSGLSKENVSRRANVFTLLNEIPRLPPLALVKPIGYSIVFNALNLLPPMIYAAIAFLGMNGGFQLMNGMGIRSITLQFILVAIGGILIYAVRSFMSYATREAWRDLGQTIQHSLRTKVFGRVQHLSLSHLNQRTYSGIRDVVADDTAAVELFYEKGLEDILRKVATFVYVELVYLFLAPVAAMLVFAIVFGFWVSWTIFHRNATGPYREAAAATSDLNDHISKNIAGAETVRSYVAEQFEIERMQEKSIAARIASGKAAAVTWFYSHLIEIFLFVSFLFILTISGVMLANGLIEVGSFIILVFMIPRIGVVFEGLEAILEMQQRANSASRRITNLLRMESQEKSGSIHLPTTEVRGDIEYKNVSFAYPDRTPVFSGINITIPSGTSCAFVGSTGAGKSTLAKLLLRFYDVESGALTLDGRNILDYNVKEVRAAIGYVSQDTYLFNGTLIDNIRFGKPSATKEEVIAATKMIGVYDFIASLDNGFETVVGERGQFLSGGQRQLISISRAFIKNPPIFIFDEATSSLDNETESLIHKAISSVMCSRTTIVIAHRLSTIVNADKIHVISDGKICESGSHRELTQSDGMYAALWKLQSQGA